MNYRHIYHAGNFADVFKHIVLTRLIDYLKRKDQAFRVIDTHAGIGIYDLSSKEAQKTGEWLEGVGKFLSHPIADKNLSLLKPWLETINTLNHSQNIITQYPGSPYIIRNMLRKQDRMTAIELHHEDYAHLTTHFANDFQTRLIQLDGYLSLKAHLPVKEKRGLILVDPPFEEKDEFQRIIDGLRNAYRRFSGGMYVFWYPVKHYDAVEHFLKALHETSIPKILRLELRIRQVSNDKQENKMGLDGSGLIIINPPYILEQELQIIEPLLIERLGQDKHARLIREWIREETV
ncbi:23S rRNA (adenine(2030)-N(6))-methyltransferase RlmJ [Bartonella tamiae]|uniref:Ribosomal RNA large subunit methyltransferase J n=1 Tax=Bartonella tamiae Th239 TaxID=1094558 RepID=J1JZX5_9HYPH|nr:23S rRNA (adenine(2030)-N(6))-methyltransferase RlmJ [Bartonella tamiae]EJF90692.1 hypothetical protein ME5_01093 [Bartonella tamiae Th239]EJF93931.1 hypothetical protein MEG_00789 [Bartonella tamiae Th307]